MKRFLMFFVLLAVAFISFSFVKDPARKLPSKATSKAMAFPVAGKRSNMGDLWGASRGGGVRKHKGIDIYARKGTPVVALTDGVIVISDNTVYGGKTLWLKAANHPWKAYYAHLDKKLVKQGQFVRKGQVIGTVGNTGNARTTPSHLHFGIQKGKGWVNPLPYVKNAPKVVAKIATTKKGKAKAKVATKRRAKR